MLYVIDEHGTPTRMIRNEQEAIKLVEEGYIVATTEE
jgi:hypothetical protein